MSGLPYIFPLVDQLRQSGSKQEQLPETFQFIKIFGGSRTSCSVGVEEAREVEGGGQDIRRGDPVGGQIGRLSESPVRQV